MELARTKADLLAAAQRSGVADTPALRAQIDQVAQGYVNASSAADLAADRIKEVQDASKNGANSVAEVFAQLAAGSITAEEAVRGLILQIIQLTVKKRILAAIENSSGSGGGGGFLGGILGIIGGGFAEGGYTGNGGKYKPAGIVHGGEFVISKAATAAIGVGNLEALHSAAKRGYSGGGLVGGAKQAGSASKGGSSESQAPISITNNISVEGSAGTPEQNNDLAKKMAQEMEGTMRGVVVDEIRRQQRPGNMMNGRRSR